MDYAAARMAGFMAVDDVIEVTATRDPVFDGEFSDLDILRSAVQEHCLMNSNPMTTRLSIRRWNVITVSIESMKRHSKILLPHGRRMRYS